MHTRHGIERIQFCMKHASKPLSGFSAAASVGLLLVMVPLSGCELQQRRMDVPEASGADESIDQRFGLTADAQDPTERDKEMGYGKWKAKPDPVGTRAPTSPTRRGKHWGSDQPE